MDVEVLRAAVEAAERRETFVLATVVWRRGPTSGRAGSQALVRPDSSITGFVGGACAEPTVVAEAQACLASGEPRRLLLGEAPEFEAGPTNPVAGDAVSAGLTRRVAMACASEGAIEVHLEPHVPAPRVVVVGDTPVTATLLDLLAAISWDAVHVPDDAFAAGAGGLAAARGLDTATAVVVASQGHVDEPALRDALATEAGWVGVVASRKRAHEVVEALRDEIGDNAADRVHAPAGLDLGPTPHREIAVAILAELVALRASGGLRDATTGTVERPTATDPVCGMQVDVSTAVHRHVHDGTEHLVCADGCRRAFAADPSSFVR